MRTPPSETEEAPIELMLISEREITLNLPDPEQREQEKPVQPQSLHISPNHVKII